MHGYELTVSARELLFQVDGIVHAFTLVIVKILQLDERITALEEAANV